MIMNKHQHVEQLVTKAYASSSDALAHWMWENHLPVVAEKAEALSRQHNAKVALAVAGAWLHDFGDAFLDRHDKQFDAVSEKESRLALTKAGYTEQEVEEVLNEVIKPHECKGSVLPRTIEAKILTTADAYAHFMTDFYLSFCWMHIPRGKTLFEFIDWVTEKIERDYHTKIFFDEVRKEVQQRYEALRQIFVR